MAAVNEKQKLLVKQRQEIEETERNSDKEVCPDYRPREFIVARCIYLIRDSQSVQTNPIHYTDSNTLYSGHDFQFSKTRKNALFLLNFNETLRQNLGVPG